MKCLIRSHVLCRSGNNLSHVTVYMVSMFRLPQSCFFPPKKTNGSSACEPPCAVQCGTKTTGDSVFTITAAVVQTGGVEALKARQATRKAPTLSDRRCLQPYKGT